MVFLHLSDLHLGQTCERVLPAGGPGAHPCADRGHRRAPQGGRGGDRGRSVRPRGPRPPRPCNCWTASSRIWRRRGARCSSARATTTRPSGWPSAARCWPKAACTSRPPTTARFAPWSCATNGAPCVSISAVFKAGHGAPRLSGRGDRRLRGGGAHGAGARFARAAGPLRAGGAPVRHGRRARRLGGAERRRAGQRQRGRVRRVRLMWRWGTSTARSTSGATRCATAARRSSTRWPKRAAEIGHGGDDGGKGARCAWRRSPSPRCATCARSAAHTTKVTARSFYEHSNTQDYLHITLTDEEEILDAVGKLRSIYPNLLRLDYDNARTRAGAALPGPPRCRAKRRPSCSANFTKSRTAGR